MGHGKARNNGEEAAKNPRNSNYRKRILWNLLRVFRESNVTLIIVEAKWDFAGIAGSLMMALADGKVDEEEVPTKNRRMKGKEKI